MINSRDVEQLSAYLDGQLNPSDSARLESRISSDAELASALSDIRAARGILRKMPARKAPRNFILTRKMVGLKPPLPQSFSFFRLSTAVATILLLLTFAANSLPSLSFGAGAAAPAQSFATCNGCGGAATQAPAATAAPMLNVPSMKLAIAPTETLPSANADSAAKSVPPTVVIPMPKAAETEPAPLNQARVRREAVVPVIWQISLLIIILASAVAAFVINQNARKKWR